MTRLLGSGLGYAGILLVALGLGLVVRAVSSGDTVLTRYYRQYTAYLERSLHLLFLRGSGPRIVLTQAACVLLSVLAGVAIDPLCHGFVLLAVFGPYLHLSRKRAQHV